MIYLGGFCHDLAKQAEDLSQRDVLVYYKYKEDKNGKPNEASQVEKVEVVKRGWWNFWITQHDAKEIASQHERLGSGEDYSLENKIGRAYAINDAFKKRVEKYKKPSEKVETQKEMEKEKEEIYDLIPKIIAIKTQAERAINDEKTRLDRSGKSLSELLFTDKNKEAKRYRLMSDEAMLKELNDEIEILERRKNLLEGILNATDVPKPKKKTGMVLLFISREGSFYPLC